MLTKPTLMKPTSTLPRPDWSPTHSDLWQLDCCAVCLPTDRSNPPRYAAAFCRAARRDRRVRRARRLRMLRGMLSALLLVWACATALCGVLLGLWLVRACASLIAAAATSLLHVSEAQAAAVCFLLAGGTLLVALIQFTKSTGPDN